MASPWLTQEQFNRLLNAQKHTCGMCHEPFEDGQLIHVDHDHACCRRKNRSCGKCLRGLLCHTCNIALGHIERRYAMTGLRDRIEAVGGTLDVTSPVGGGTTLLIEIPL